MLRWCRSQNGSHHRTEVFMDGDHDIDKCYQVTTDVLNECYNELELNRVNLKGTVLKPNMIVNGINCKKKVILEEIAQKTLICLKKCSLRGSGHCFFIWWTI